MSKVPRYLDTCIMRKKVPRFLGEKFHLCNKLLFMDTLKSFEAQFKGRSKLVKFVL